MSGGILHNIAVQPSDLSQGSFFTLLARVFGSATKASGDVVKTLASIGWHVSPDGVLRDQAGLKVPGRSIRNEFSGPDGKVPKTGPDFYRAKMWAENFHKLFVNPDTWSAQSRYAAEWLAGGNRVNELKVYNYFAFPTVPMETAGITLDSVISLPVSLLPPEIDLAMCVYHAFSVNAPSIAMKCLASVKYTGVSAEQFAMKLIRALGTRKYGNWQDSPGDGSNRYDRARRAVWARSDLWPLAMSKKLMPMDL
jgi:hypothetical protein